MECLADDEEDEEEEEIEFEMVVPLPTPDESGLGGQTPEDKGEGIVWWVEGNQSGQSKVCEAWWVGA